MKALLLLTFALFYIANCASPPERNVMCTCPVNVGTFINWIFVNSFQRKSKSYIARTSCNRGCKGKNQRCHIDQKLATVPFCGTNKCWRKRDCKDVGSPGKIWARQNKARICNRGRCVYNMDMDKDKDIGGFHLQLFDFSFV